jgi:hypothetical protein
MSVTTTLAGASNEVLQEALSAYSQEAYTNAKKLSGTGIVGSNPMIDTSTETFVGQMRWDKPLNPTINVASLTSATAGDMTDYTTDYLRYIKTVRTHGAEKVNMKQVVTQRDGLARIARDFGETRSQDEHNAILSVLKGVAASEALRGSAAAGGATGTGGQSFSSDPTDATKGFYVDLGASKLVYDNGKDASGTANLAYQGASRAEGFLNAMGAAWKDYEPDYAYLVCSPAVMASLRSANLVDQDGVQEGNIMFNTIFQGKFRLIQTRANQSLSTAELTAINAGTGTADGTDITGGTTSFIVLPGALAMAGLMVPEQVEIDRNASAYMGGGTTQIWYRWGYVLAPAGYDWVGPQEAFPSDADYASAMEGSTKTAVASLSVPTDATTTGIWQRKASSVLSLGILPVFHS